MPKGISRTAQGYYHDRNPYKLHGTQADAKKDRSRLIGLGVKIRKPRVSTFYTILQDKRKNNPTKFGSVPQGPHTFPFHGIHHGIIRAYNKGRLNDFKKILPTPSKFNKEVDEEIPKGHPKRVRAELAKIIYAKRHKSLLQLSKMKSGTDPELRKIVMAHRINQMIQLSPYGSYAYKGKGAGKGAVKGKGESSLKPVDQQIDMPKNSGIKNTNAVTTRSQSLIKLFKGF